MNEKTREQLKKLKKELGKKTKLVEIRINPSVIRRRKVTV